MSSATVRINEKSHKILKEIAELEHKSMPEVLDELLEAERRRRFFEQFNAGYAALKSDTAAWEQEQAERKLWDNTLMDGLDPDEQWNAHNAADDDGGSITNE